MKPLLVFRMKMPFWNIFFRYLTIHFWNLDLCSIFIFREIVPAPYPYYNVRTIAQTHYIWPYKKSTNAKIQYNLHLVFLSIQIRKDVFQLRLIIFLRGYSRTIYSRLYSLNNMNYVAFNFLHYLFADKIYQCSCTIFLWNIQNDKN